MGFSLSEFACDPANPSKLLFWSICVDELIVDPSCIVVRFILFRLPFSLFSNLYNVVYFKQLIASKMSKIHALNLWRNSYLFGIYLSSQALVELLDEEKLPLPAWISFNSKDGVNVVKGDSMVECVTLADKCSRVVAVGINCTPPRFILNLIRAACKVKLNQFLIFGKWLIG